MNKQIGSSPKMIIASLLIVLLALQNIYLPASATERQYRMNVAVSVDGADLGYIPALDDAYENNLYLSLKGLSYALQGTDKAFTPVVEKDKINITSGADGPLTSDVWEKSALDSVSRASALKHEMYLNGSERKYYSFILTCNDAYDAFLTPVSLALLFDLDMKVTDGRIEINTSKPFSVSMAEIEDSGYLQGVNALLIGDGTTGEIIYRYHDDTAFPIASTTKLMTYLIFMEAVSEGKCSLEDTVTISEKASRLSYGVDGVTPMKRGSHVTVTDLIYGMLLVSSNECALALAEHAAGSEEAFVQKMNEKAQELGLADTEFYNCHGLPVYEDQLIPAKVQNRMTAQEMFLLCSHILDTYPQITDFTAVRSYYLDTIGMQAKNSNAVLYNMEQAVGLKTGTTNKAGACLVTCVCAEQNGRKHNLVSVLFGADGDASRGILSELSARYAEDVLLHGDPNIPSIPSETGISIPLDPELVIRKLLLHALP